MGLKFSRNCNTDLALASLETLTSVTPVNGAILHTDQGVTYKNKRYMQYATEHGMKVSMSKKGCPYDNCVIENFWGTLKVEKIYRLKHMPNNIHELEQIVKDYLYLLDMGMS